MFPERPGVMASPNSLPRPSCSPATSPEQELNKISGYFDHVEKARLTRQAHVVVTFRNTTPNGISFRRGTTSRASCPKESAEPGAGNGIMVNGTGRLIISVSCRHSRCRSTRTPRQEPDLLGYTEKTRGVETKRPLVDKSFVYFGTIKGDATAADWALRTPVSLDIMENLPGPRSEI